MAPECSLSEVANITMGTSPKGETYNQVGQGLPLLNGPTEFGSVYPQCTLFTMESVREGQPGDLIFCVRGSTTGRMNWADRVYSLGRGVCSIRGKTSSDTRYIKYCLDWKLESLLKLAGGGTFPNLTQDTIRNFKIPYPEHRRKIASILSAYDDLIENNQRRIKILEEMAQNLYREWFVKFRFPGHEKVNFVDSPLGRIPEGWEVVKMPDAVFIRPSLPVPKSDRIAFVTMGNLSEKSMIINGFEYRNKASGSRFQNEDTLFARITPCLENGKTGFVQFLPDDSTVACGSTEFIVLRSRTVTPEYVYLMARSDDFRDNAIKSMTGASGRQRVSEKCFDGFLLAQPPNDILSLFQNFTRLQFKLINSLNQKNTTLRRTRDLLLPKLISGEIDVSDLDIAVPEEVAA